MTIKNIYLNNAAAAYPLAPGVAAAVARALDEPPMVSGRDTAAQDDGPKQCRCKLAEVLRVDAREVALTPGATYALNTAILGLPLLKGDLVISTVMEHNSVIRPLSRLTRELGIRATYIPLGIDCKLDINKYNKLLREKPRLVIMTHASNVTGRVNPIKELFADAKAAGAYTLLDASQTIGRLPVYPRELYADMAALPGYKALRGVPGAGALYVSQHIELNPVFTGGTGIRSDLLSHPEDMPLRLEAGTPNTPAFSGLYAALCYYMDRAGEIEASEKEITRQLYTGLSRIPGICIYDDDLNDRLPVISFELKNTDSHTLGYTLKESFGISARAGLHCAPLMHKALGSLGTVRFSPSYFTGADDINYAIEAVRMIAG